MPTKPLRPCNHPGCPELVSSGYCTQHQPVRQYDRYRGTSTERGYNSKWRKARASYLLKHSLCVECQRLGQVTAATVVDHIKDHKGDQRLFWDTNNWQALCKRHHDSKTARTNPMRGRGASNLY